MGLTWLVYESHLATVCTTATYTYSLCMSHLAATYTYSMYVWSLAATCIYMNNHLYRAPQCTGERNRKRKKKKEDTPQHYYPTHNSLNCLEIGIISSPTCTCTCMCVYGCLATAGYNNYGHHTTGERVPPYTMDAL